MILRLCECNPYSNLIPASIPPPAADPGSLIPWSRDTQPVLRGFNLRVINMKLRCRSFVKGNHPE